MHARHPRGAPDPEFLPERRGDPRKTLGLLERYVGLRVRVTYGPKSENVNDPGTNILGEVRGTKRFPPALVLHPDFTPDKFTVDLYLTRILCVEIVFPDGTVGLTPPYRMRRNRTEPREDR